MNIILVIGITLALGLLSTRIMKLFGMPNVTGYLIVGLIIGPYALKIIPDVETLDALEIISTIALGFIAFSIGVEFKLNNLKQIGKSAITITFCQALCATLCVDLALIATGFFTNMPTYEAIILGAIATATAPAATLMVVRQYKAQGIVTGTLLPVVALDDAVGLVVFAISNSIALSLAGGVEINVLSILVWPICEIVVSLLVGAAIGFILSLIPRIFKSRDNRLIGEISCVFLCLGVCELFKTFEEAGFPFGLSDLLVCMMAGAIFVNAREEAINLMEGVNRWTPVLFMMFFILSGAELDLSQFFKDGMLIVCIIIYVLARCCGKYFGTMFGASVTKCAPMVRKYLGITLFPQAGVAIGMATMCKKEFDSIGRSEVGTKIVTITMCAVLIYELIGPVLTKWALTKAGEIATPKKEETKPADAK